MIEPNAADYPPGTKIKGPEVRLPKGLWLLTISDSRNKPLYRSVISTAHENAAIPFKRVEGGVHISTCGIVNDEVVIDWHEVTADSFKKNAAPVGRGSS